MVESRSGLESGDESERTSTISLDEVMTNIGIGRFHVRLVLACGLGFSAAAVEVVLAGFLITALREDWGESEFSLSMLPTIVGLGSIIGEFFWGYVADRCGRRPVFLATVCIVVVFGVLSALSQGMVALILFRLLVSFGYGGNIAVDFALFAEFLPTRLRGEMLFTLATFWPLGQILTTAIAWLTIPHHGWRVFLLACAAPSFLTAFLRPFIPESPRHLLVHGYEKEAREVLRQIAELNGVSVVEAGIAHARLELGNEAEKLKKSDAQKEGYTFPPLFSKSMWRTTTGCLVFQSMLSFGGYATTTFMPSFLEMKGMHGVDMYASMLISSVSQVPGIMGALWVAGYGRLRPIYVCLILQAIPLIIFSFATSGTVMMICSCIASAFLEFGWALNHVYVPEVFPTEFRSFALGTVSGIGSIASLITPTLTAFLLKFSSPGPAIAVFAAVLALGSAIITCLLHVETLDRDLADSAH